MLFHYSHKRRKKRREALIESLDLLIIICLRGILTCFVSIMINICHSVWQAVDLRCHYVSTVWTSPWHMVSGMWSCKMFRNYFEGLFTLNCEWSLISGFFLHSFLYDMTCMEEIKKLLCKAINLWKEVHLQKCPSIRESQRGVLIDIFSR